MVEANMLSKGLYQKIEHLHNMNPSLIRCMKNSDSEQIMKSLI